MLLARPLVYFAPDVRVHILIHIFSSAVLNAVQRVVPKVTAQVVADDIVVTVRLVRRASVAPVMILTFISELPRLDGSFPRSPGPTQSRSLSQRAYTHGS